MDDAYKIDKKRVRDSFGRAAAAYDAAAVMQHEVFERMFDRLSLIKIQPERILDAGCGTGWGQNRLAQRYGSSHIVALDIALPMLQLASTRRPWWSRLLGRARQAGLCADIESLPIKADAVDMVWSNLAIQWCNDLDRTFRELHRALRPQGMLMFSTFGPDTLMELRSASGDGAGHTHVSRFYDMHDIGDALVRAGFADPVMDVERFTLTYEDVLSLMRDLKIIGAHNATEGRPRGLEGKAFLKRLGENYEQFRQHGKLPATYEVVYGHAWKGQPKMNDLQPVKWHYRK